MPVLWGSAQTSLIILTSLKDAPKSRRAVKIGIRNLTGSVSGRGHFPIRGSSETQSSWSR